MSEARKIADFIGVPLEEVIRHAGIEVRSSEGGEGSEARDIPIVAEINSDGRLNPLDQHTKLADYTRGGIFDQVKDAPGPPLVGAVIKATDGGLAILDDALVMFAPDKRLDDRAVGALAIVEPRGSAKLLARIEKARKSGIMLIRKIDGEIVEIEVVVATPVEIIYP